MIRTIQQQHHSNAAIGLHGYTCAAFMLDRRKNAFSQSPCSVLNQGSNTKVPDAAEIACAVQSGGKW